MPRWEYVECDTLHLTGYTDFLRVSQNAIGAVQIKPNTRPNKANTTVGFIQLSGPDSPNGTRHRISPATYAKISTFTFLELVTLLASTANTAGVIRPITNSGNVQLEWAQNSSQLQ